MSVPGAIAVNNLRRIVRQPIMLFTTLVLPFLVIAVVGFALGGSRNALETGVVSHDYSSIADNLVAALRDSATLSVVEYSSDSDLERAVRRGEVSAGVVIPAGLGSSLRAGGQSTVDFVSTPDQTRAASIRTVVQSVVQAQVGNLQAALFSQRSTGRPIDAELARAAGVRAGLVVPTVVDRSLAATASTSLGFNYTAPSNLVLFIVITSLTSAGTLVESRNRGITARMMTMPPSRGKIVAGELLGRLVIAVAQAAIILLFSSLLFGVRWGDPIGVAAITVMMCAVGAALGLLVGFGARTLAQTASFGPPVGVVLGMLGGCMWPLSIVGGTVAAVGHISPDAWAMDGYLKLTNTGAGFTGVLPQVAVLSGFAAVVLAGAGFVVARRGAR